MKTLNEIHRKLQKRDGDQKEKTHVLHWLLPRGAWWEWALNLKPLLILDKKCEALRIKISDSFRHPSVARNELPWYASLQWDVITKTWNLGNLLSVGSLWTVGSAGCFPELIPFHVFCGNLLPFIYNFPTYVGIMCHYLNVTLLFSFMESVYSIIRPEKGKRMFLLSGKFE